MFRAIAYLWNNFKTIISFMRWLILWIQIAISFIRFIPSLIKFWIERKTK